MVKTLLLSIACLVSVSAGASEQDSLTAAYINSVVERIDARLLSFQKIIKDTVIYEEESEGKRSEPLRIRMEIYFNPSTHQVEKIIERSRFRTWVTELDVYFLAESPIRLTSTKWNAEKIVLDFDLYYMQNSLVFCSKRDAAKGRPDADFFLKWSYDLLQTAKAK
jgi:hypothetical protein